MKPIRIQRKRTRGFRMPPGVIYVGRGSRWGNPFKIIRNKIYYPLNGEWFQFVSVSHGWDDSKDATTEDVVRIFCDLLMDIYS